MEGEGVSEGILRRGGLGREEVEEAVRGVWGGASSGESESVVMITGGEGMVRR